ncbi:MULTISPECIES: hypothetical protein [unclassified Streptomyces]|uniref:hypothetical protein n=1 Tax=unclassified Streptomyces TaxID=2593676 RepID=UPI00093AF8A5|nr:hypothetical protein [Streptomyces sp. CB01883]OKJ74460.1 hypothetical protein AMK32_36455 [Streptomyces sp. CB01883]
MATIHTRRLAPLLIATTLATGGLSLTATSAFAVTTTTATGVTTDTDDPNSGILNAYSKHRDHQRIPDRAWHSWIPEKIPPGGVVPYTPPPVLIDTYNKHGAPQIGGPPGQDYDYAIYTPTTSNPGPVVN